MTRRLLVFLAAIAGSLLFALPAQAATIYSQVYSPPVDLYVLGSFANVQVLPTNLSVAAASTSSLSVTLATNWVDTRATVDSPNVVQQGLFNDAGQFKVQIAHGATPASHVAQCRVKGSTGAVLANGPKVDVADGAWHTVICTRTPTTVRVYVDGLAGPLYTVSTGAVASTKAVTLGGRSTVADTDSLDGQVSAISYDVA